MMRKVVEYNNDKYKTSIYFKPHYIYKGNIKTLNPEWDKTYYDICLGFYTGVFGWQVIKYNEQYYVGAPGITDYLLYEGELNVLDIIKFLVKEYKSNDGICINPELFNLLK